MATRHQAGAEWVHVRPHSDDHAPGKAASDLRTRQPRRRLFLAPDHRPPLAGIKLVRPRPRLPARRCGRSSLTPDRRGSTNRQRRGKATTKVHPDPGRPSEQVTGSTQYALLTTGVLMGAVTASIHLPSTPGSDPRFPGWTDVSGTQRARPWLRSRPLRSSEFCGLPACTGSELPPESRSFRFWVMGRLQRVSTVRRPRR